MRQLLLIMLALGVIWCALVAGAVTLAVLALRRALVLLHGRARTGARQLADRARLRAGSYGSGPPAEAARLRLDLRNAVTGIRTTVTTAVGAGWPVGDAPSLVCRLERVAAALDTQLRLIALDRRPATDDRELRNLADLRDRVGTVVAACADLRASLHSQAVGIGDDELYRLREDCRIESEALRGWNTGLTG